MTRTVGDRREHIRFEVFGAFWGSLDVREFVTVHDLTSNGALIEAAQPLAIESVQSICLVMDGQPTLSDARVRHTRAIDGARHLMGIEFVAASSDFLEAVERLMTYRSVPAESR